MLTSDELSWLQTLNPVSGLVPNKTFFDIGARGYYENPMTEILAFYLNPNESHGLGTGILELFLRHIGPKINDSLDGSITCELQTQYPERIDLTIVTSEWVITIENKIFHKPKNPFEKYNEAIYRTYPNRKKYHFLLLAPYDPKSETPPGWVWVNTCELFNEFLNEIKSKTNEIENEWMLFLRHFIRHIINVTNSDKGSKMENEELQNISNHIGLLMKARDLYSTYVESLKVILPRLIEEVLSDCSPHTRSEDWGRQLGLAMRTKVYPNEDFDITFLTLPRADITARNKPQQRSRFAVQYLMTCNYRPAGTYPEDMKADDFEFLPPAERNGTLFWFWAGADEYLTALDLVRKAASKIGSYRKSLE